MKHSYTVEEFKDAVAASSSIRQTLIKLGLEAKGGNYRVFHKFAKNNNVDTSHFKGQAWNKGDRIGPKRPIEDYLNNTYPIQSGQLRKRLIREKFFEHQCSACKRETWLENPIPLELDHIDGNHSNNNLSNLRLLCPNCHALTPTYRGKNKKKS
jgi:hypothetical protein